MKTMKKWMAVFLAALCVTMTGAALADDDATSNEAAAEVTEDANEEVIDEAQENFFTGTILEIDPEAGEMLMNNTEMGEVLMRFETELLEGLPTLYPGVTVTFETTGIATMSLPAQMNAVGVECIFISGAFRGFEDGMMLIESEESGMVAANLDAGPRVYGLEHITEGAQVNVFFNGMMTRSIPAQIVAEVIAFEAQEELIEDAVQEAAAEGTEESTDEDAVEDAEADAQ